MRFTKFGGYRLVSWVCRVYLMLNASLYKRVLSTDLNFVWLLHVPICFGNEFHVVGAAYLNYLAANILCLIFGISSIRPVLFEHIFSHIGFLMVMSSCRYFGAALLMHLNVNSW